jgi:hypothetical protein
MARECKAGSTAFKSNLSKGGIRKLVKGSDCLYETRMPNC